MTEVENMVIIHICLICGTAISIPVSEYHNTLDEDPECSGVIDGCPTCGYAYSLEGRVDPDDPEWAEVLFDSEEVDSWEDKDWKKMMAEYFERHPDEKEMLEYQKMVTRAFVESQKALEKYAKDLKKEDTEDV